MKGSTWRGGWGCNSRRWVGHGWDSRGCGGRWGWAPRCMLACVALLAFSACTPLRSTLKPPYVIGGVAYDEKGIQAYASARCSEKDAGTLQPPHAFTTDGCSLWPNGAWKECCVVHDLSYWCGGPEKRSIADRNLQACVAAKSSRTNAFLMHLGVRAGGSRWWPFPWRWGYGYSWPYRKVPVKPDDH
jgi:hypothetical protein